jgi:uncharacterized membrane protein
MTLLALGLVLFFGIHSLPIVSPSARERLVVRIGRGGWRALHSVLSLAGLVLIIIGYGQARHAPVVLYTPPYWLRHVTFALMLPVFPLILAAYLPGRIRAKLVHPMLVALKTWAVAHLLSNGNLADVLLFGAFLAWAVADRISLKRRASGIALSGWPGPLNDAIAVVAGLGLYVLMVLWGHRVLIGMPLA